MKIGIVLTGISHGFGRDCLHCVPNINSNLIEPFKKEHDVKTYLTTYSSPITDAILTAYNPTVFTFLEVNNSHQVLTYTKSMESLRGQDLDLVICTRFDIHFHKKINEIGIDHTKFNALFKEKGWWDSMKFTTDNFFAFSYSMLEDFISVLKELYTNPSRPGQTDLHQVFHRVQNKIGSNNTNIISNVDELSNTNSFYSLCNAKWGTR